MVGRWTLCIRLGTLVGIHMEGEAAQLQEQEDDDIDFEALRWEAQERKLQGLRSEILDEVRVYTAAGGVVVSAGSYVHPTPSGRPSLWAAPPRALLDAPISNMMCVFVCMALGVGMTRMRLLRVAWCGELPQPVSVFKVRCHLLSSLPCPGWAGRSTGLLCGTHVVLQQGSQR